MVKIKVDDDLYGKLEKCAATAGYSGTEEFITHVLEKAVAGIGAGDDAEKVKEKLRGLGYLS
ncbi:MAG: hypothetical protein NTX71_04905 [Candidatus Aureabacteria bacterium]|nr:hypothetical protein [Candidatus Auribacterota bacterium]